MLKILPEDTVAPLFIERCPDVSGNASPTRRGTGAVVMDHK